MPTQVMPPHTFAEMLNITPWVECRCLGFNISRLRHCKNRISPASRAQALKLLNLVTEHFNQGRDIRSLLADLASMLLCIESHQSQVRRLANKWDFQAWRYWVGRRDSTTTNNMGNSENRSVQGQQGAEARALRSDVMRGPMQPMEQTQQAPAEERRPQRQPPGQCIPARCWVEPANRGNETLVRSSSGLGQAAGVTNTSVVPGMVAPRVVDGECGICLLGFLVDVTGGSAREYTAAEKKLYETRYDYRRWVWCRHHCGTNYHRDCMDRWIMVSGFMYPKCPTCSQFWLY
ncbi:hypothetical protein BDV36DRAFT_295563 [Aspergillus pseudocaelatus]|uniref:RING-type domain-containing protein n=1 Tax=Aspergillus pseudocaelatus TaxID=1825620 RepID=A0ABQ6WLI5_9EURO|nr:hypothetical protein BDV36DRAFT_295563 [Aspergillus pseudocaelatus]